MVEGTHQISICLCCFCEAGQAKVSSWVKRLCETRGRGGLANSILDKGPRVAGRINNGHFTEEHLFFLIRLSRTPTRPSSHLGLPSPWHLTSDSSQVLALHILMTNTYSGLLRTRKTFRPNPFVGPNTLKSLPVTSLFHFLKGSEKNESSSC